LNETNERFKRAKSRKKTPPVRHVSLSDDAKKAYEALVHERDARERDYGRHLTDDRKGRR
jgi:hypothetical protein